VRKHQLIVLLSASAIAASSCASSGTTPQRPVADRTGATPYPVKLRDATGAVTIPHRPTRIVSLSATATQMLYAIGAGSQVVAVDSYSTYPSSAPRTKLSGFQPNVEAIARYRPDLVVNDADVGNLSRSLQTLHIPVLIEPAAKSFVASYQQIDDLGDATDHADGARKTVASMRAQIARIVASVPRPTKPLRIYHELDPTFYSATTVTFIGQIYRMFGLRNVADKAGTTKNSGYPQLSAEYVVASNPQVIVLADTTCCHQSAHTLSARPGWSRVDAVRHDLVLGVDDSLASEWGPHIVEFVARVAGLLQRAETVYGSQHP
jgi:iron complex transport system substrate-binding protein